MNSFKIMFVVSFLLIASSSSADCIYDGKSYSEGSKIGPYVCINGEWILG